MPAPRPRLSSSASLRAPMGRVDGPAQLNTHYLSTCKLCQTGIYKGQPYEWVRGRVLGLCHLACVEEAS